MFKIIKNKINIYTYNNISLAITHTHTRMHALTIQIQNSVLALDEHMTPRSEERRKEPPRQKNAKAAAVHACTDRVVGDYFKLKISAAHRAPSRTWDQRGVKMKAWTARVGRHVQT